MSKQTIVERADLAVAEACAPARDHPATKLAGMASELADQPQLISICSATLAAGLVTRNAAQARAGARMLAAHLLATTLKSAVKHRVNRTRPHFPDDGGEYRMEAGNDQASEMNSFPSGHTAGAVAVARALVREYPEHRPAAYAAAAGAALIQVPRCQHYPSDLAAGTAIGLVAEAVVDLAAACLRVMSDLRSRNDGG